MSYIANKNITVNCLYGTFKLVENVTVENLIAKKFPQHVIEVPELEITSIQEDTENKNERKGK